jgi:hypothetical protein
MLSYVDYLQQQNSENEYISNKDVKDECMTNLNTGFQRLHDSMRMVLESIMDMPVGRETNLDNTTGILNAAFDCVLNDAMKDFSKIFENAKAIKQFEISEERERRQTIQLRVQKYQTFCKSLASEQNASYRKRTYDLISGGSSYAEINTALPAMAATEPTSMNDPEIKRLKIV